MIIIYYFVFYTDPEKLENLRKRMKQNKKKNVDKKIINIKHINTLTIN